MLNLGDKQIYEGLLEFLKQKLQGIHLSLDVINRVIGTLNVLHALNKDLERFIKVGELIISQEISYRMWKYPKEYETLEETAKLEKYSKELGFETIPKFLTWLQDKTPNPNGIAPCGYDRSGMSYQEKKSLQGDRCDIHVHSTEFLTREQYDALPDKGLTGLPNRRQGDVWGLGMRPLLTWPESIKHWSDYFVRAVALAIKTNDWKGFANGLGTFPCGQGRFAPLELYVKRLQQELQLTNSTLEPLCDAIPSQFICTSVSKSKELFSMQAKSKSTYTRTSLLLGKAANERIPRSAHLVHDGGERMQPTQPKSKMERVYSITDYIEVSLNRTGQVPNARGFSLIAEYISKKHDIDIFVAEDTREIKTMIQKISDNVVPNGVKIGFLVKAATGHWYALKIEKLCPNKLELTLMDSLGDGQYARDAGLEEFKSIFIEFLKMGPNFQGSLLHHNVDRMQFDPENCGTFSMTFLKNMLQDRGSFSRPNLGNSSSEPDEKESSSAIIPYLIPEPYYFGKLDALKGNTDAVIQSMRQQYAFVQSGTHSVEDGFEVPELGGKSKNPYYQIFRTIRELRDKYFQKAVRGVFDTKPPFEVKDIERKRNARNVTVQDIQSISVRHQPLYPKITLPLIKEIKPPILFQATLVDLPTPTQDLQSQPRSTQTIKNTCNGDMSRLKIS